MKNRLTSQELQAVELAYCNYKQMLKETLQDHPEALQDLQDITSNASFFFEVRSRMKDILRNLSRKVSKKEYEAKNKALLEIVTQGQEIESELLGAREELIALLKQIPVESLSPVQRALEPTKIALENKENARREHRHARLLEELPTSKKFLENMHYIKAVVEKEGGKFSTHGDLLAFRKEKGGEFWSEKKGYDTVRQWIKTNVPQIKQWRVATGGIQSFLRNEGDYRD